MDQAFCIMSSIGILTSKSIFNSIKNNISCHGDKFIIEFWLLLSCLTALTAKNISMDLSVATVSTIHRKQFSLMDLTREFTTVVAHIRKGITQQRSKMVV